MFADTATIEVRAGKGGDGRLSFRHEKFRAHGGPDGGNGGRGGNVVFELDHNQSTLSQYRTIKIVRAADGAPGGTNRKHGKSAESAVIKVPAGTQVWERGQLLADITTNAPSAIIAHGGRGGFGNAHFIASTRQAPRAAELGEPGEARTVHLELKLVADIGLVGLPNAGKSTLLSVISNAKPEIADYPFTTLVPHLGLVDLDDNSFLAADIPGLIEGASLGKGLGHEFLRHLERTAVLLQLVDGLSADPAADWRTIDHELESYGHNLRQKPRLTVLTKIEALTPDDLKAKTAALEAVAGQAVYAISAQAHKDLEPLLHAAAKLVAADRAEREQEASELPVIDHTALPDLWRVEPADQPGSWRVTGIRLEGFARRTDFDSPDAIARLHDILRKTGVAKDLRRQGAQIGDHLLIGAADFPWAG